MTTATESVATFSSTQSLLEVRELSRRDSNGTQLLAPTSFSIRPGDRIVCTGSSGAGKTVLLRAVAKLDQTAGEIRWRGNAVNQLQIPPFRSQVIYLQQNQLLPEGTVRESLQEPFGWKANQRRHYHEPGVVEFLSQLGRESSFLDAKTIDLSGGESQIVAIVRALLLEPDILLLDEPTSALDDATTIQVEQLVDAWLEKAPRALIWVTHDQQQAERIATRRFQIDAGRLTVDA